MRAGTSGTLPVAHAGEDEGCIQAGMQFIQAFFPPLPSEVCARPQALAEQHHCSTLAA